MANYTHEQAQGYLAAMIDGEGYVHLAHEDNPAKKTQRMVRITSTEWDIIEATLDACDALGVKGTVEQTRPTQDNRQPIIRVLIQDRDSFLILADLSLGSARKRQRIQDILDSYTVPGRAVRKAVYA